MAKEFKVAFAVFTWLIRKAKCVVCMDANLSNRTYRNLQRIRCSDGKHKIFLHHNIYKNANAEHYHITTDIHKWTKEIHDKCSANKKFAVVSSSLCEANVIYNNIIEKYPEKSVIIYSSKTNSNEKALHFSDVNTYWSNYDIIIYTPTVSAGVSHEIIHFDCIFGFFTNASCNVEICLQMLGRVRNVKTKSYYICFSADSFNMPTDLNSIRNLICGNRRNLFGKLTKNLDLKFTSHGRPEYIDTDYFWITLENIRISNLSKNSFIPRFLNYVSGTGAKIILLDMELDAEDRVIIADSRKENKFSDLAMNQKLVNAAKAKIDDMFEYRATRDIVSNPSLAQKVRKSYLKYHKMEVRN